MKFLFNFNIIFMKNNKIWKCIENFSSILLPLIWVCFCVEEMGGSGGGVEREKL